MPAYQELDEALALTTMIESEFCDNRKGKNSSAFFIDNIYRNEFHLFRCNEVTPHEIIRKRIASAGLIVGVE